jgi:hypothetical protein
MSDREVILAPRALRKRQAADRRDVYTSLLLLCFVTMVLWVGFLGWGFGYLIGIW